MAYLNGVQIARQIANKALEPQMALKSQGIVNDIFAKKFAGCDSALSGQDMPLYHKKIFEVINECEANGVPHKVAHAWLNIILDKYEKELWQDCTLGQKADLFVASNSSEIDVNLIFGGGRRVEQGTMHGNFGLCMNARKKEHVLHFNDFVPFSYLLSHNNVPAAIIFLGDRNTHVKCGGHVCKSTADAKGSRQSCSPQGLAYLRLLKYVEDVRRSHHYADVDSYYHVRKNSGTGKEEFLKIPLIPAVYDGNDRTAYRVNHDCTIGEPLHEYLQNSGLAKDGRIEALVYNLKQHIEDEWYTLANGTHEHHIKQVGCVDLRIRNVLMMGGMIKEMGSVIREEEKIRILVSEISNYLINKEHTFCGYRGVLIQVHMASNEIKAAISQNSRLRKIISASVEKIANGETDVLFGAPELRAAINEVAGGKISPQAIKTMEEFISGTSNDTRKTMRHAVFRGCIKMDEYGYPIYGSAQAIEDAAKELLPPATFLTKEQFGLLVGEQSARENYAKYAALLDDDGIKAQMANARPGAPEFYVTEAMVDLKTGYTLMERENAPQSKEELLDTRRNLFYEPGKEVVLLHDALKR